MNPATTADWLLVFKQTKALLEYAIDEEWQTLAELQEKRDQLLKSLLAREVNQLTSVTNIKKLLQLDDEIVAILVKNKEKILQNLLALSRSTFACQVYAGVAMR